MKIIIVTLIAMTSLLAATARADQITDAQIANLENLAQVAYSNADVADARGQKVAAAQFRRQAQNLETQANYLRQQEENLDQLNNAIQQAASQGQ